MSDQNNETTRANGAEKKINLKSIAKIKRQFGEPGSTWKGIISLRTGFLVLRLKSRRR